MTRTTAPLTRRRRNVQLYLAPADFQNLQKEAHAQSRPITNLVGVIVREWLATRPTKTARHQSQASAR